MDTNFPITRRHALQTAAAGAALWTVNAAAQDDGKSDEDPPELKSEFLCEVEAELESGQSIGDTPFGNRTIFYVKSGTVKGPKINGEILPGGGDWYLTRPDGVGEIDVRGTVKTDDGALIYIHYPGIIDASRGYFRTTPRFETASKDYAWLNNIIAVGMGRQIPGGVGYYIYQIL